MPGQQMSTPVPNALTWQLLAKERKAMIEHLQMVTVMAQQRYIEHLVVRQLSSKPSVPSKSLKSVAERPVENDAAGTITAMIT